MLGNVPCGPLTDPFDRNDQQGWIRRQCRGNLWIIAPLPFCFAHSGALLSPASGGLPAEPSCSPQRHWDWDFGILSVFSPSFVLPDIYDNPTTQEPQLAQNPGIKSIFTLREISGIFSAPVRTSEFFLYFSAFRHSAKSHYFYISGYRILRRIFLSK